MGTFEVFTYCGTAITITIDGHFDGREHGYIRATSCDTDGSMTTLYYCDYIGQRDKSQALAGALRAAAADLLAA